MLKVLFTISFATIIPLSASYAQNKIIVINKDGTREEMILNQETPVTVKREGPKVKTQGQPQPSAQDLIQSSVPAEPIEKVIQPKAVPKPAVKTAPPKKKTRIKQAKPTQKSVTLPYPKPKPSEQEIAKAISAKPRFNYIDPTNIPEGTPITEDLATRVALEVAPPSLGFQVFVTEYEGVPAYQVRFKTENGPHDVIIDGATGKVLKK